MQVDMLRRFQSMQATLAGYDLQISEYHVDKKNAERVTLTNGVELVFGRGDIEGKLNRLLKIYVSELVSRVQEIRKIDVRYTNGLAVEWRPAIANVAIE